MRRRRMESMPERFDVLANYNAERGRGIMHTAEWDAKMADLQRKYDDWLDGQVDRLKVTVP